MRASEDLFLSWPAATNIKPLKGHNPSKGVCHMHVIISVK